MKIVVTVCGFLLAVALALHFTGHRTPAFWVASAGNAVLIASLLTHLSVRYRAKRG